MALKFIAPTTYDQARFYLGKDVKTPAGDLKCSGCSGVRPQDLTLSFGFTEVGGVFRPTITWSAENGWETYQERKARRWDQEFAKLSKTSQALVKESFALELPKHELKEPSRLVAAAIRNAIRRGHVEAKVCGRCGGSGRYSWNAIHGDRCYGCQGSGKQLPSASVTLKAVRAAKKATA